MMRRVRIPGHEAERTCTRLDDGRYRFDRWGPGASVIDTWTLTLPQWCDLLVQMVPGVERMCIANRAQVREAVERIFEGRALVHQEPAED